jgi:hypothetical protein
MRNINFNFGGFYESLHESIVEEAVAYSIGAVDEDYTIDYDLLYDVDISVWSEAKYKYCVELLEVFFSEAGAALVFVDLVNPVYYNYITDYIIGGVDASAGMAILKYIRDEDLKDVLRDHVRDVTTSRDGYDAFVTYEDIFKDRGMLLSCACDVIIKKLGEEYPFYVEGFAV